MTMPKADAAGVRDPGISRIPPSSGQSGEHLPRSCCRILDCMVWQEPNEVGHRDSGTLEVHGCPSDLNREARRANVSKFLIC